jgi:outer membrane immunogenic protein
VAGAEVSWSATNLNGSGTIPAPAPLTERSTSAPLWFSTVSGRLGYAFNDLLLYAKAGGGWMNVGYTQNTLAGGLVAAAQSIGAVRNGFVGGVGLEYALTENFSARLEYDYYDFGTRTYDFPAVPIVVAVRSNLNVLAIAVNYRFNWAGGGPIAAKY